ncbi:50S ribosomal protein L13 [candidate division TA06 bacterium]|uniref:Large ribosomal subunit protein uL13 n=1 Tax=candidate division TA06 bacterium TaxID=2250710 RepID=A0A523XEU9_UNCT6|nr:MAG: 50S ribosomal protein L13 [candidate division TA06 bacterium]TET77775.1 MAG: 50S ribosomal protein L13 [candidate division TA06 bacterium]
MTTKSLRKEDVKRTWFIVDAKGRVLGRLATKIARKLHGKDKKDYTPHVDNGDFVVCINASQVYVSGKKRKEKMYYRHSGYIGSLKAESFERMIERHPDRVIRHAVKGMLPDNKLRARMMKRLKVYGGSEHPHEAQKPVELIL